MQFNNLENEITKLINRLKYDFEKFKSSMIKLIQKVEISFQDIISKISISKSFLQNFQQDQKLTLSEEFFNNLVQELNKKTNNQYSNLILNKLANRLKVWEIRVSKMFDMKVDRILKINDVAFFNEQLKLDSLKLINDKTIKLSMSKIYYAFALFDQPVSCNKIQHFLFKIHNFLRTVGIGFANSQVIETNQYKSKLETENHGSYLCFSNKVIMHHGDPTKNNTNIGIIMEVGDIIELIFNPFEKSITWKNLNNDQQYSTVIDNINQELRGCVVMKHKDTKVQIGDDELMFE